MKKSAIPILLIGSGGIAATSYAAIKYSFSKEEQDPLIWQYISLKKQGNERKCERKIRNSNKAKEIIQVDCEDWLKSVNLGENEDEKVFLWIYGNEIDEALKQYQLTKSSSFTEDKKFWNAEQNDFSCLQQDINERVKIAITCVKNTKKVSK